MSNEQQTAHGSAAEKVSDMKYRDMSAGQKFVFIGKVGIFFLTLGFAYPNIFLD